MLATVVEGLGHEVIARSASVREVAATTARKRPDVALVGLGENSEHALELISEIVMTRDGARTPRGSLIGRGRFEMQKRTR